MSVIMKPALLQAAIDQKAGLFVQFGGQAGNYFPELQAAFDNDPATHSIIDAVSSRLLSEAAHPDAISSGYINFGINVQAWLSSQSAQPDTHYLASSVVSQPLIFLTQVANMVSASKEGWSLADLYRVTKAATGHSQGILPAMLLSLQKTGEDFISVASDLAAWLFWQGIRMQQAFPIYTLDPKWVAQSIEAGEGAPSPMAAIMGMPVQELSEAISFFNERQSAGKKHWQPIYLTLKNTWDRAVLSAPPESLAAFRQQLISRREIRWQYIATTAPFHSPYMANARQWIMIDLKRLGISFRAAQLKLPLYSTADGSNLQHSDNLMRELLDMMFLQAVDWPQATSTVDEATGVTHVIDFGPGEASSALTAIGCRGKGVSVISFATTTGKQRLFSREKGDVTFETPWSHYLPVVEKLPDGREIVTNRFTEFAKHSPIFAGGMTPCTAEEDVVAAAANAGYIVELAGGGQVTESILRWRLDRLVTQLKPGKGIIFNTLFLDPYLWNLHYPLLPKLREEGYPIMGVTISAGIPDVERAVDIIQQLTKAGIWCNSLKPGTDRQIVQVLEIAEKLNQTIIMQVEGGKAGGHHSWEDLHALVLRHYARIRNHGNVILCVGGGIWNGQQAASWLNGSWHGRSALSKMPVDAVFYGTRLMAAKEVKTSPQVKAQLVETKGTTEWVRKDEIKGGITSQQSQLGADIHYIENSATRVGRALDALAGKSSEEINAQRDSLIALLNQTCKPYFGDLDHMTYASIVARIIELMTSESIPDYLPSDGVWYDRTFRMRLFDFMRRIEERLAGEGDSYLLTSPEQLDKPTSFYRTFISHYPKASTTRCHPEDMDYFLLLCRRPGKPVNFVPVIDENIRKYYKSDSLWQAHDPRYPADAVLIIPGPEAVQGIQRADEAVADIFDEAMGHIKKGLQRKTAQHSLLELFIHAKQWAVGKKLLSNPIPASVKAAPTLVKKDKDGLLFLDDTGKVAWQLSETRAGVSLLVFHHLTSDGQAAQLKLDFAYQPANGVAPFFIEEAAYNHAIRSLFVQTWGLTGCLSAWIQLSKEDISRYGSSVGESSRLCSHPDQSGALHAPINYPFIAAFESILRESIKAAGDSNILKLVHLKNSTWSRPLLSGKKYSLSDTKSVIYGTPAGKQIEVSVAIKDGAAVVGKIKSHFLIRGELVEVVATAPVQDAPAWKRLAQPYTLFKEHALTPTEMASYSLASKDCNPIHTQPFLATLAGFDHTIVHGMWTSACATSLLARHALGGNADRILGWDVEFLSPVQMGQSLLFSARHVALDKGRWVVEMMATVDGDLPVMRATALIEPPKTAYVYTGQGSQMPGMGLDTYDRSTAARAVWDEADEFCRQQLGFSILHIVRDNPKELLVSGERVFHPEGVLHLTQFTQVSLTVVAMAAKAELEESGAYVESAMIAGHSLGEYAALSCSGIIALTDVIRTVYHRGLTMQHFVPRNAQGISPYQMAVVRPNIVHLSHQELEMMVCDIAKKGNGALEVVNYNIRGEQYSVTGEVGLLKELEGLLRMREAQVGATKSSFILLEGIDVPFHSLVLRPGVEAFRQTLEKTIPTTFDLAHLIGRYIPNLNAKPFALTKAYLEEIFKLTQSPVIKKWLAKKGKNLHGNMALARSLLIELLAYQFASPVQWIATQDVLLGDPLTRVDQIIEIGPRPTLSVMAKRSVGQEKGRVILPDIYHVAADRKDVYFIREELASEEEKTLPLCKGESEGVVSQSTLPNPPPPQGRDCALQREGILVTALTDIPLDVKESLKLLLALKLTLRPDEISDADTIEKLSGGNSARRNEILADIGSEFNIGAIDDAQNKIIPELAIQISSKSKYAQPGSFLRLTADKAIKDFLPINRAAVMAILAEERLLPPGHLIAVINRIALMVRPGDSNKSGPLSPMALTKRLSSEKEARSWLNQLVNHYAQEKGMMIPGKSDHSTSTSAVADSKALQELESRYFGWNSPLMKQSRQLLQVAGVDVYEQIAQQDQVLIEEGRELALYRKEVGEKARRVMAPVFDEREIVSFRSGWNWARRDLIKVARLMRQEECSSKEDLQQWERYFANWATPELLRSADYLAASDPRWLSIARAISKGISREPLFQPKFHPTRPRLIRDANGHWIVREELRKEEPTLNDVVKGLSAAPGIEKAMLSMIQSGESFAGKTILITGAGPGSIALEIVKNLLSGGARIIVTTSSYSYKRVRFWRSIYQQHAGRDAQLHLASLNQGSLQDIESLLKWIDSQHWIVDALIPFGAVGDLSKLSSLDADSSTATLRVLLQGVYWLVAAVANHYRRHHMTSRRCHILLPLSPNHGQFGGDGLYGECKRALDVLMNKWHSEYEDWGRFTTIIGAVIGWTRGTGLMEANDLVAEALEKKFGVRTFSSEEMAFLLTTLLGSKSVKQSEKSPITVDVTGGFGTIPDVGKSVEALRHQLTASMQKSNARTPEKKSKERIVPKSREDYFSFPELPSKERAEELRLRHPELMQVPPNECVVVVGFGEISPYGQAKTRFEFEKSGTFSLEGCIDLAWMMGFIRYENGSNHVGWIDNRSEEPLSDFEIKMRYEAEILKHTGVRFTEASLHHFDPHAVTVFADVVLEEEFVFPVDSMEHGMEFIKRYGQMARLVRDPVDDSLRLRLEKGAVIKIPKAVSLSRYVAGQIPTGFDPTRFGIPKEMINQVDRTTIFNIVATVEAFLSAGLAPQELYDYMHPTRVGNTQGGGMGGMWAIDDLYHNHREDKSRQSDTLQETLINVTAAWITQSYLGSYGPTVHPVGACATAVVSMDTAYNLLQTGKAEFVVAGGFDDYSEEGAIGFTDMQATCETQAMLQKGIPPQAMSRPNDSRRGGFVEAHGGGTILLTTLDKAVEMALPIYAILACSATHSDGFHTSIPAPGLGLLGMKHQLKETLHRFGLSADDITVVSKHDTSTGANDPNENELHHRLQQALGRSQGNPLLVHSQKAVLGHSKGGAGAWQANAAIQMLNSGIVPGNPNLDDVDEKMRLFETMCFTDESIDLGRDGVTAVMITSLGFGHVGAGALFLHPDLALTLLDEKSFRQYADRRASRHSWRVQREWGIRLGKEPYYTKQAERLYKQEGEEAEMLLREEG